MTADGATKRPEMSPNTEERNPMPEPMSNVTDRDPRWDGSSAPRYRHEPTGMALDPKGAYVLAHMAPAEPTFPMTTEERNMDETGPRTEAGRQLRDELEGKFDAEDAIVAIESEARSQALDEVEAAVKEHVADLARAEDNPGFAAAPDFYGGLGYGQESLNQLLALLASLRQGDSE